MIDLGDNCPVCKTTWTKTSRIVCGDHWIHCVPCGKKAEDIIAETKKDKFKNDPDWHKNNSYYATDRYTEPPFVIEDDEYHSFKGFAL